MTEASDAQEARGTGRATLSVEGRRLIGQAIMDGILTPDEAFLGRRAGIVLDYTQQGGNYTQSGGGNYSQSGGGNYTQSALQAVRAE
jgi:hypothetical protein